MTYTLGRQEVRDAQHMVYHAAAQMKPGESERMLCPFCDGGSKQEKDTFIVTRTTDRDTDHHVLDTSEREVALYYCHRASCGMTGVVMLDVEHSDVSFPAKQYVAALSKPFPDYAEPTVSISDEEMEDYRVVFPALQNPVVKHFRMKHTLKNEFGKGTVHIPLSLYRNNNAAQGYLLRNMYAGNKKRVYWKSSAPVGVHKGAWFQAHLEDRRRFDAKVKDSLGKLRPDLNKTVVMVEDAISAICVARYAPAYATLGSGITDTKMTGTLYNVDNVILWMDPDMWEVRPGTNMAPIIPLIARLGSYVKVIPRKLPCDPKYMDSEDIKEALMEDYAAIGFDLTMESYRG